MQFKEVVGQSSLINQLLKSVNNEKLSHAILFAGPEGYGGLAIALALATYLNCQSRTETDSCGACPSCQKMKKLIHPDLHFSFPAITDEKNKNLSRNFLSFWRDALIENPYLNYFDWLMRLDANNKQGNIPIEEGREIVKNLSLKAHDGHAKIQIIWMADYLKESGNALLKIIEEPSPDTYFILIANNIENILKTILSRAQVFLLPPILPEDIAKHLLKSLGIGHGEASSYAKLSNGDYMEALRIAKSTGNDYEEQFSNLLRYCYQNNLVEILEISEKLATRGREFQKDFFQYGLRLFRECLLFLYDLEKISCSSETEKAFLSKLVKTLNHAQIETFYTILSKSITAIEHNANPKIIIFNLSLRIIQVFKNPVTNELLI